MMTDHFDRKKLDEPQDGRSPFSVAMEWTSRISVISMEMVVPTLGGLWLDSRFHTLPLLVILGGALGFWIAIQSLLQISKSQKAKDRQAK